MVPPTKKVHAFQMASSTPPPLGVLNDVTSAANICYLGHNSTWPFLHFLKLGYFSLKINALLKVNDQFMDKNHFFKECNFMPNMLFRETK